MVALLERPAAISVRRAGIWCIGGFRLWRRYPLRLFLLSLTPIVLEWALQQIPLVGVSLSKIFPSLLSFGLWLGLADGASSGTLRWSSPFLLWSHYSRWRALGLACLYGPAVFVVQQFVVAAIYGWPAVDAVLLGHGAAHPDFMNRTFSCLLILSGIPIAVLLGLAPMFVLFRHAMPAAALRRSVRIVCQFPAAFVAYAAIQFVLFAGMLVVPFGLLLLLPLLPWACACSYVIWNDIDAWTDGA
jgi:hypothetical protein